MIGRSRGARLIVCLLAAYAASSCGARLMTLPAGPGAPAPDARQALEEATRTCRAVSSMTADASVSGSAGGRRLRARLSLGVQAPASARLEAIGPFARAIFILAARGDEATLLLEDTRILQGGRPAAVLEAITGVPLDAADLREALTGCASVDVASAEGRQLGDEWRTVRAGGRTIYLNRNSPTGSWLIVATLHQPPDSPEWRAEYRDFIDGLPRTIRLVSTEPDRFNLRLEMRDIELNPTLEPRAFEVRVPASAQPITLDELRRAGPLGDQPR